VKVSIGQSFKEHGANVFAIPFATTGNMHGQTGNICIVNHFSILSVVRPQVYHRASNLQQIKQKKISGPTHPRHHLSREKIKENKTAAERKNPRA